MPKKRKFLALKKGHPLYYVLSLPYEALLSLWLGSTFLFATCYFLLSYVYGQGPAPLNLIQDHVLRFLNALYFSVITATSTGYGDIVPQGISKLFASLQSMGSIIIVALFVAKFAAAKQEIALEEIHELSFNSAFHAIREGLFIGRKDLDLIIKKVNAQEGLKEKDWRNLYISFHQMQIFIRQIPSMYKAQHRPGGLDIDRERLLIDAVERTLRRVSEALAFFVEVGIPYKEQEGCVKELKELCSLIQRIFAPHVEKTVDQENREAIKEVLERSQEILREVAAK